MPVNLPGTVPKAVNQTILWRTGPRLAHLPWRILARLWINTAAAWFALSRASFSSRRRRSSSSCFCAKRRLRLLWIMIAASSRLACGACGERRAEFPRAVFGSREAAQARESENIYHRVQVTSKAQTTAMFIATFRASDNNITCARASRSSRLARMALISSMRTRPLQTNEPSFSNVEPNMIEQAIHISYLNFHLLRHGEGLGFFPTSSRVLIGHEVLRMGCSICYSELYGGLDQELEKPARCPAATCAWNHQRSSLPVPPPHRLDLRCERLALLPEKLLPPEAPRLPVIDQHPPRCLNGRCCYLLSHLILIADDLPNVLLLLTITC